MILNGCNTAVTIVRRYILALWGYMITIGGHSASLKQHRDDINTRIMYMYMYTLHNVHLPTRAVVSYLYHVAASVVSLYANWMCLAMVGLYHATCTYM